MNVTLAGWLFAIPLLGLMTGNRTMTPMAVLCWFAYAHRMPIHHSWAFWATMLVTPVVFTVLALGEFVGDKLPKTPNRTALIPLIGRLGFGGLVGAICAESLKGRVLEGVLLGAAGALAGTFLGYHLRRYFTQNLKFPDFGVALLEDVVTVSLSIVAMLIVTG